MCFLTLLCNVNLFTKFTDQMSTVSIHSLFSFHLHLGQSLTYFTQHNQTVTDCIATADTLHKVILPVQYTNNSH